MNMKYYLEGEAVNYNLFMPLILYNHQYFRFYNAYDHNEKR